MSALALLAAACGGSSDDEPAADTADSEETNGSVDGAEDGAIERPDLKVGVTPAIDFMPVFQAVETGAFEEHGLNVEIVEKGRSDVPPLIADEYQVGTMASATYIQAVAEGFNLRALYPGADGHTGAISIMAMPDSGIESMEDLAGRSVAVNQPGAAFEIFTRIVLEDAGIGQDSVEFSVIPFSSMVESLVGGQVDAAVLVAPFNTIAESQGAVTVVDPFEGLLNATPIAGYTVTQEFAEQNPNTVDAFVSALDETVDDINSMSPEEFGEVLTNFTSIGPDIATDVFRPEYPTRVDAEKMQELTDLMFDMGVVRDETEIAPTVVSVDGS